MLSLDIQNEWRRPPHIAPSTWTPLNIASGLVGYVNFEDNSKITLNAGGAAQIIDSKNAAIIFAQATAANQPRVQVNSITHRQVAQFDGVAMNLVAAPTPPTWQIPGAQEWWVVCTQEAPIDGINRNPVAAGNSPNTTVTLFRLGSANILRAQMGNGTANTFSQSPAATTLSGTALMRCKYDGANIISGSNGVGPTTPAALAGPIAVDASRSRIGANSNNTIAGFWTGGISAVVVINGNLSAADENSMYNWAAQRLGLAP